MYQDKKNKVFDTVLSSKKLLYQLECTPNNACAERNCDVTRVVNKTSGRIRGEATYLISVPSVSLNFYISLSLL